MKYLLLFAIQLYWLVPKKKRRKCIFRETCSQYIYRIAKERGLREGYRALKQRRMQCKRGYYYLDGERVRLADGSVVTGAELNEGIL